MVLFAGDQGHRQPGPRALRGAKAADVEPILESLGAARASPSGARGGGKALGQVGRGRPASPESTFITKVLKELSDLRNDLQLLLVPGDSAPSGQPFTGSPKEER